MKRLLMCILAAVLVVNLTACGTQTPAAPKTVLENEHTKIDGIFVDTSYQDDDGAPLKMVYVFLTINSKDSNMKVSCNCIDMKIGENTYSSEFYKNSCLYMPNYYYSSFIEDVYVGSEIKVALTFKVPEGDLQGGKIITLADDDISFDGLTLTTDSVVACTSVQQIGEAVDATGCADIVNKLGAADDATVKKVRKALNGYYFQFYVSAGTSILSHELEFFSPNKFEIRSSLGLTNTGTYDVRNGYIFLHYETNDEVVEIPYEFSGGDILLYCDLAFSIYE